MVVLIVVTAVVILEQLCIITETNLENVLLVLTKESSFDMSVLTTVVEIVGKATRNKS